MRTISSINRQALIRARGGQNKGVTVKQVKLRKPQVRPMGRKG